MSSDTKPRIGEWALWVDGPLLVKGQQGEGWAIRLDSIMSVESFRDDRGFVGAIVYYAHEGERAHASCYVPIDVVIERWREGLAKLAPRPTARVEVRGGESEGMGPTAFKLWEENAQLRARNTELDDLYKLRNAQLSQERADCNAQRDRAEKAEARVAELEGEREGTYLAERCEALERRFHQLEEERDGAKADVEKLERERDTLRARVAELKEEIDTIATAEAQCQTVCQGQEEEVERLESEYTDYRSRITELCAERDKLRAALRGLVDVAGLLLETGGVDPIELGKALDAGRVVLDAAGELT